MLDSLKIKVLSLIWFLFISIQLSAQTVSGSMSSIVSAEVRLEGFNGFATYLISQSKTDQDGKFSLTYSQKDYGIGYLVSENSNPLLVVLSGEDLVIVGESLDAVEGISVLQGQENSWFQQYASEQPRRAQANSAWIFLERIYSSDPIFSVHGKAADLIASEKKRIKEEDLTFVSRLPDDSYLKWFLPLQNLVSNINMVVQYIPEEIDNTIASLRGINYADERLYKSGLLKDLVEGHFWLIENSAGSLEEVYAEMQKSIDLMLPSLLEDNDKLNKLADHLFNFLESRSLFRAAEYLSLTLLNEQSCTLNSTLAQQFESYRKMKAGNIVPDIRFTDYTYFNNGSKYASMKEVPASYKLVVFAAGWCPHCIEEIPKLLPKYEAWKEIGLEVIMVSLDDNLVDFANFAAGLPFISTTDFLKWEGEAVLDYHVFGTPTFYLLDKDSKILLRPNSVNHLESWIDWNLK